MRFMIDKLIVLLITATGLLIELIIWLVKKVVDIND